MTQIGIILAGGRATRMGGGDKCLCRLGELTLLEHVVMRLEPQVDEIVLNANGDPARFSAFGLPVIADASNEGHGPLAGILAGLDWAAENDAETIVSVAADTPFFPSSLVENLTDATQGMHHPLAMAATPDGRHPTFGIWPVSLRNDLRKALDDGLRKVILWTDTHNGRVVDFDTTGQPFFNINTPADLQRAKDMFL